MFRGVSRGSARRPMRCRENVSMHSVMYPFSGSWVHRVPPPWPAAPAREGARLAAQSRRQEGAMTASME
eukprot:5843220-Pyramimonas_sp.AAC.1